jgi:hypothetical protein
MRNLRKACVGAAAKAYHTPPSADAGGDAASTEVASIVPRAMGTLTGTGGLVLRSNCGGAHDWLQDFRSSSAPASLTLSVAAAESTTSENTISDTSWQHHLWSQRFDTISDSDITGSIAPQALSGTGTRRPECVPAGLTFSNPPLPDWRIGSCS